MKINKDFLKSPWVIGIGTAIFSFLLTVINDYLKNKPKLSTISNVIKGIYKTMILILKLKIKVWWLILGIIAIFSTIFFIVKFKESKLNKQLELTKPDFCNYKEGKLKRWKWTWNWKWNNSERVWHISNLTAYCPNCDTPLTDLFNPIFNRPRFKCPRCDFDAIDYECENPDDIKSIILDNISRSGKFIHN
ncbi:MAG TPA: zinc ribbon domain-containing protein [Clostridia bacterium]